MTLVIWRGAVATRPGRWTQSRFGPGASMRGAMYNGADGHVRRHLVAPPEPYGRSPSPTWLALGPGAWDLADGCTGSGPRGADGYGGANPRGLPHMDFAPTSLAASHGQSPYGVGNVKKADDRRPSILDLRCWGRRLLRLFLGVRDFLRDVFEGESLSGRIHLGVRQPQSLGALLVGLG